MIFTPGLEQLDPALLAFVKCHVTSAVRWEILRVLAGRDGAWVPASQLGRLCHRRPGELDAALAELAAVVLRRLIEATTRSQELRGIIAAQLQRTRQRAS